MPTTSKSRTLASLRISSAGRVGRRESSSQRGVPSDGTQMQMVPRRLGGGSVKPSRPHLLRPLCPLHQADHRHPRGRRSSRCRARPLHRRSFHRRPFRRRLGLSTASITSAAFQISQRHRTWCAPPVTLPTKQRATIDAPHSDASTLPCKTATSASVMIHTARPDGTTPGSTTTGASGTVTAHCVVDITRTASSESTSTGRLADLAWPHRRCHYCRHCHPRVHHSRRPRRCRRFLLCRLPRRRLPQPLRLRHCLHQLHRRHLSTGSAGA